MVNAAPSAGSGWRVPRQWPPLGELWFHQSPPGDANNPQATATDTASPEPALRASQLPHRTQGRWELRQQGPQTKVRAEPGGDSGLIWLQRGGHDLKRGLAHSGDGAAIMGAS